MAISLYPAPSAAAKSERTAIFNSTGNWTAPADVTSVEVILCGGGGGGLNQTGSGYLPRPGGGGSVWYDVLTVTPSSTYVITIGGGGTMGTNATAGTGGTSSFGNLLSVVGGDGAGYNTSSYSWGGNGAYLGGTGGGSWTGLNYPTSGDAGGGAFGLGGGGAGGGTTDNGSVITAMATDGGGQLNQSGSTNTGGGGSGASNGGSGVCIIKYWSAL